MSKIIGREVVGQRHGKTKEVFVSEWGGNILIRELGYAEVVKIQGIAANAIDKETKSVKDLNKLSEFSFELIRLSWVNEDGSQVLTPEDYEWLVNEPNSVITTMTSAMSDFSQLNPDAVDNAKKNSQPTLNGASGSNSLLLSEAAQ